MRAPHIHYKAGYLYQTNEGYAIQTGWRSAYGIRTGDGYLELCPDGWLMIKKGYAWDGPSGPCKWLTLLPIIGWFYRWYLLPQIMRGALVHDAFYQLMRSGLMGMDARGFADDVFRLIMIEDGTCWLRAWWIYQGVSWFAAYAARPSNRRPVLRAPKAKRN